ncbi:hypothetical protein G3N95_24330 [Paraburkholderia sp. Tr-20389]|uniref:hypothetical protein n=1 Tax=Paraburkholderia sp. Tr-20389 TaxID=2703903 RepID=UPI00197E6A1E|nr:hypothetical protein [Paraburkholderia sp. Tr-20389]MBN3756090.1 hypothetical protein [Paraburkholderia sp. Tr-20389]
MNYVAKLRDGGETRYGYGETDHAAVQEAVSAMPVAPGNKAWLVVYTEDGNGAVDTRYTMPYGLYRIETE